MYVVRGVLSPEVGAMLMRAVEAVGDALFVAERTAGRRTATRAAATPPSPPNSAPTLSGYSPNGRSRPASATAPLAQPTPHP